MTGRRSFWAWGLESEEPTDEQRRQAAARLSARYGVPIEAPPVPRIEQVRLRPPRIQPPPALAAICSTETHERAAHHYGKSYRDIVRAFRCDFPNPPDVVAFPRNEAEVAAVLEWCGEADAAAIPYGGGSSVVGGVEPPGGGRPVVSIDLRELNRVLEVDPVSRAARIQAGVLGPALEAQLRPHGFTLRHYPQSFEWSSLGGWIATRSGGHYATNHTHIDDFVESVRMITPRGAWESRRLPGSGAGPSPDRFVIGSEGTLGIITEAWMRIQARPRFRASAGMLFPTWEAGYEAARRVVQAKLWPANCRLLDPAEAEAAAGGDGVHALLILGFESAEVPQGPFLHEAVRIARECGGEPDAAGIRIADGGSDEEAGRQGAVGAWRNAFIRAPYQRNLTAGTGVVGDTFETAITWDRWPAFDRLVREKVGEAIAAAGGGSLTCRFTHVYPDGPAPYYSFQVLSKPGGELETWAAIKQAASDAVIAGGGTITHHHAVGRDHMPWYRQQRPPLFAEALRAVKAALDPQGLLNPGILLE
ncbi:FAD-binding oxidoreductase [Tepidiforma sp.]|uniref:FAD-binding oxidoreductase n=1 Tax=Tepidiforma sp. TaxID=2682230 RepID=UPI00261CCBC1|nr:FAD-binding oxidoreductase [Tepidiforma sp.]MCX7618360.1 FAD-binding oxidoreductase [Tepidiforma sp.]